MSEQKRATPQQGTRLNKVIAEAGLASRRGADTLIAEGRVRVNGQVVTELGTRVGIDDLVTVDNKPIASAQRGVYIVLNKPKDAITTTRDERGRRTVLDLINVRHRVYPVGRLDRNTTGVLVLTNDGDLAYRLMHPRYGVERWYEVTLDRPINSADTGSIASGVRLDDGDIARPGRVIVDERDRRLVTLMLQEGKNREVRRIFEAFNYKVERLHRTMYAGMTTSGLGRGDWRFLTRKEVRSLRHLVGLETLE